MMRELSTEELDLISGHGNGPMETWIRDAIEAVGAVPDLYDAAINAAADMMCRGTGNC